MNGSCYSPLRESPVHAAEMSAEDEDHAEISHENSPTRGCFVVVKDTGTCICCVEGGGLESVDVAAMARLTVALHGFCKSAGTWSVAICGCHLTVLDGDCFMVVLASVHNNPKEIADAKLRVMIVRDILTCTYGEAISDFAAGDAQDTQDTIKSDCVQRQLLYDGVALPDTPDFLQPFEDFFLRGFVASGDLAHEWFAPFRYACDDVLRVDLINPSIDSPFASHVPNPEAEFGQGTPAILEIIRANSHALVEEHGTAQQGAEGDGQQPLELPAKVLVMRFSGVLHPFVVAVRMVHMWNESPLLMVAYFRDRSRAKDFGTTSPPFSLTSTESVRHLYFTSYAVAGSDVLPPDLLGVLGASVSTIRATLALGSTPLQVEANSVLGTTPLRMEGTTPLRMEANLGLAGAQLIAPSSLAALAAWEQEEERHANGLADSPPDPPMPSEPAYVGPPRPPPAVGKHQRFAREKLGEFETDSNRALPPIRLPPTIPKRMETPPPECVTPVPFDHTPVQVKPDVNFETPSSIIIASFGTEEKVDKLQSAKERIDAKLRVLTGDVLTIGQAECGRASDSRRKDSSAVDLAIYHDRAS